MTPLELLYYFGYSLKKNRALQRQKRLPCRVISIGNLTLGGTGKTPATIFLAREARQRGWKPCILTRGYRGKAAGPCFVSNGEDILLNEHQAGDEALLIANKLKGIPVVKGQDRYKAGIFALSSLPDFRKPDLFILDDGFQHWVVFRDKDVLLIDSMNPFGNRRLFPIGPLREPVREVGRADVLVITRVETGTNTGIGKGTGKDKEEKGKEQKQNTQEELVEELRRFNIKAPVFYAEHRPSLFLNTRGEDYSLAWGKGKPFYGFCGIGNPSSFEATLIRSGVILKGFRAFRDHYRYSQQDIDAIRREAEKKGAGWIVTTEKDIMRLRRFSLPENLMSLAIEFNVSDGFYDAVLNF
jgi:tetraacyldisaccharide 4'-kinase